MNTANNVSIVINEDALKKINEAIAVINTNLPGLITLKPEERQTLPKMGDKTVAFVSKALDYARLNPDLLPKYLNLTEFEKDVEAVNQLFKIVAPIQKLNEQLDDTAMLAGSEAYSAALVFYNVVKGAINAGETGLKYIYDDLSTRFPGRSTKRVVTQS